MKYSVAVSKFPKKTSVKQIRAMRLIGGMSLRDVVSVARYCEGMNSVNLVSGIENDVAAVICESLRKAGCDAAVVESDVKVPMVINPKATSLYKWSWNRIVKTASAK
jgi:hypothetical protein